MGKDRADQSIVGAICALAKSMNVATCAEGVETIEQFNALAALGCDEMQGYYFSTPVAAQDFAELLRSHSPKPLR